MSWNIMEHARTLWNIPEYCGRLWKAVEKWWNVMESDGTFQNNPRNIPGYCRRLWNLLEHDNGKQWKVMEGDGAIEPSRTFYAKF